MKFKKKEIFVCTFSTNWNPLWFHRNGFILDLWESHSSEDCCYCELFTLF